MLPGPFTDLYVAARLRDAASRSQGGPTKARSAASWKQWLARSLVHLAGAIDREVTAELSAPANALRAPYAR